MKTIITIAIFSLLVGCTDNITSIPIPTTKEPLNSIGSAVQLDPVTKICVLRSKELSPSWPVDMAVFNWNKNGANILTTNIEESTCRGIVLINEIDTSKYWGNTEFFNRSIVNITLNSGTPVENKSHVICHELGHVLGLPHSTGDNSCMDINEYNTNPIAQDLVIVAKEPWIAATAGRKACQC